MFSFMLCFASHHLKMEEECTERCRLTESYKEHDTIPAVMENICKQAKGDRCREDLWHPFLTPAFMVSEC